MKINAPLSGSSSIGGQIVSDLTITRANGQIPAGTICLLNTSFKVTVRYTSCNGHAIGFKATNIGIYGIIMMSDHNWTCNITDTDLVMDGFAEWHIDSGRFGCNGTRNSTHNNYVSLIDGANGPNSLWINNSQFNDITSPTCWINWINLTSASRRSSEYNFFGNHLEITGDTESPHSIFCSDSATKLINEVRFNDNVVLDNNGNSTVWNLGSSTALGDWRMHHNSWLGFKEKGWNLTLKQPLYIFNASGEIFNNAKVTVSGVPSPAPSSVIFDGNSYAGGLSIEGNFGSAFPARFSGVLAGGSISNTATSPVELDIPGYSLTDRSGALNLTLGNVPAVLSARNGKWQLHGSYVTYSFFVALSSKGSGTGIAQIKGLPFPAGSGGPLGAFPIYCVGMLNLAGPVLISVNALSDTATFITSGSNGVALLNESNFTTSSQCQGVITYSIQ